MDSNTTIKPFLHNELFRPKSYGTLQCVSVGDAPVLVADNFLQNFDELRQVVLSSPVGNWKYNERGRNYKDYYDCRLFFPAGQFTMFRKSIELIEDNFKVKTKHNQGHISVNWFKQINEKRADFAFPHTDKIIPKEQFTCLIYLNSEEESVGGTAFFKLKEGYNAPMENGDDYWPDMEPWEMIGSIEMKPNRLVIFPAQYYHAAYHPENGFYNNPRMTLVYWMEEL